MNEILGWIERAIGLIPAAYALCPTCWQIAVSWLLGCTLAYPLVQSVKYERREFCKRPLTRLELWLAGWFFSAAFILLFAYKVVRMPLDLAINVAILGGTAYVYVIGLWIRWLERKAGDVAAKVKVARRNRILDALDDTGEHRK